MPEPTRKLVTFQHSFSLAGVEETLPAGTYTVETVEETLENLSFVAYHRLSTTIILPAKGGEQWVAIDPHDLEAAQRKDAER